MLNYHVIDLSLLVAFVNMNPGQFHPTSDVIRIFKAALSADVQSASRYEVFTYIIPCRIDLRDLSIFSKT